MKLSDYLRKKVYFFIISLFFVVLSVSAATYSLSLNDVNDKAIADHVNNKLLIKYESGSEVLNVSEYPISNEVGALYAPANIVKVLNNTNDVIKYDLVVTATSLNEIKDLNKIYVSVNNESYNSLADLNNGIVQSFKIDAHTEDTIDVRIWISKDYIEESDFGEYLGLKLSIRENKNAS